MDTGIKLFQLHGEELTAQQLEERYGIKPSTLKFRLDKGMSLEEAVTVPFGPRDVCMSGTGKRRA